MLWYDIKILYAMFELNSIEYLFKLKSSTNYSHLYLVSLSSFFYPKKGFFHTLLKITFSVEGFMISQKSFNF